MSYARKCRMPDIHYLLSAAVRWVGWCTVTCYRPTIFGRTVGCPRRFRLREAEKKYHERVYKRHYREQNFPTLNRPLERMQATFLAHFLI